MKWREQFAFMMPNNEYNNSNNVPSYRTPVPSALRCYLPYNFSLKLSISYLRLAFLLQLPSLFL